MPPPGGMEKWARAFGGASPCLKPFFQATPGHPALKRRWPSPLRRERKGKQQSCSLCPMTTPAFLHLRAVACRNARHASVPASGTWRRVTGQSYLALLLPFPSQWEEEGTPPPKGKGCRPPEGGQQLSPLPPKGEGTSVRATAARRRARASRLRFAH